jgi:hypothetical protein
MNTVRWNFRVEIVIDQPGYGYEPEPDARRRRSVSWQSNAEDVLRQVQRHVDVPRRDCSVVWDDVCPWCLDPNGFQPDASGLPQCCDRAITAWDFEQIKEASRGDK